MSDIIRIDGVEYERVSWNPLYDDRLPEMKLVVKPKRKQTALRSLCVMDEDGWTQRVIQLPKGWEVAIDGKVVE